MKIHNRQTLCEAIAEYDRLQGPRYTAGGDTRPLRAEISRYVREHIGSTEGELGLENFSAWFALRGGWRDGIP